MIVFFHGHELGLFFGLFFVIPAAVAFFLLFRWTTKDQSFVAKVSKTVLLVLTCILMLFGLFMLSIGLQEIIDLYL